MFWRKDGAGSHLGGNQQRRKITLLQLIFVVLLIPPSSVVLPLLRNKGSCTAWLTLVFNTDNNGAELNSVFEVFPWEAVSRQTAIS